MGWGLQQRQGWTVPAQYAWPGTHTQGTAVTLTATEMSQHRERTGRGQLREQAGDGKSPPCSSKPKGHPHSPAGQVTQGSQGGQGFPVSHRPQGIPAGEKSVMPAPGAPWHCQIPLAVSPSVGPSTGTSPMQSQVPGPLPGVPGVREQCRTGRGLFKGLPPPAQARRRRRESQVAEWLRGASRCAQGPWGAWVRGLEVLTLSPFLPGRSTLSPGRPRGPGGPGGPGSPWRPWRDSREDGLGGGRWPRSKAFPVWPSARAGQVPDPHPPAGRMRGPCCCLPPGSCPPSPPPSHQDITGSPGGPGDPGRPCGPCGDRASSHHPLQAGTSTVWGTQPPSQATSWGQGTQSTHCLATVSLLAL